MPRAKSKPDAIPKATETEVMRSVLEVLRTFGVDIERQNTGGRHNDQGQYVPFGTAGNSDLSGMLTVGPGRGCKLDIEVKRPGWLPTKITRAKEREHWQKQLARLKKTNEQGGYGFWVNDVEQAVRTLQRINEGCRIEIDEQGMCWLTDELAEGGQGVD